MGGIHTVKLSQLCGLLKHYRFVEKRQKGSHLIFDREGLSRPVPIPVHGKEVRFYSCHQVVKILNMSRDEFLKELKKY